MEKVQDSAGARARLFRAHCIIRHESLYGKSTQVSGQDSSGPFPPSIRKACVASLHRCQGKTLQGPFHHPPGKPVWQVYTGVRARLFRALSTIHQESLCGKSTQVSGQDSSGPFPPSTRKACVASLHRCQGKTLQGPLHHPPREPVWQDYTGVRARLFRALSTIHQESLCGKSTQVSGQDSSLPFPPSTRKACVASLHRCQGKTLQGPLHHPPREPVWQVYTGVRARLFRALSTIHQESLCGKSTQVSGQDSSWPFPPSTRKACVASLHRCQGKTLQGPFHHPPGKPVWQVYTGVRARLFRAHCIIRHESLCGKSTQVPGQDSSGPFPPSTRKACVTSLHRCQGKTLQGPFHHPPGKPVWQVYTGVRARLFRALSTIHQESLCDKSTQMPGQDSSGPFPPSTRKACVASLWKCVMDVVVKNVNYARRLNHRQFQPLPGETKAQYPKFQHYTEVP